LQSVACSVGAVFGGVYERSFWDLCYTARLRGGGVASARAAWPGRSTSHDLIDQGKFFGVRPTLESALARQGFGLLMDVILARRVLRGGDRRFRMRRGRCCGLYAFLDIGRHWKVSPM